MDWTHISSDKAQQGDFDEQYIDLEETMHSTGAMQESIPKLKNEVSERLPDLTFDDLDLDESELDMDLIMQKVELQIHGKPVKILPPPRSFQKIEFKFTDRGLLPTTVARESEDGINMIYFTSSEMACSDSRGQRACSEKADSRWRS